MSSASDRMTELLRTVVERGASDLHLTVGTPPVLRINGRLVRLLDHKDLEADDLRAMLYTLLSQRQIERLEKNMELDFSYTLPTEGRFRGNMFFQKDSVGAAFRLIPKEIRGVHDLSLPHQIEQFARLSRGLVLVVGPSGHGKTTTLAALIDIMNTERDLHIVTIEDPIEYVHSHKQSIVNQREIGTDTLSFAGALRHALRQDPDVILVGEMRDLETIATALTAAETGHVVFATLHTQDAPQTIDRIIDVFPPQQQDQIRVQLSGSLQGVIAQQLLPRSGGAGRVPAVEVLFATPAIKNLIREAKTHQIPTALQAGGRYGMQSMDQSIADLYRSRMIDYDIAMEKSSDPQVLKQLAGR